ncbi:ABC transporter permease [Clostridia bacterium]|nr:ABC transporter permease [Clostridia bacterium]
MSSFSLALRNVRRSIKEYGIYFLTVSLGIALFYVFNSIDSQKAMMDLSEQQMQAISALNKIMSYLTVFISAIFGFLILYANAFLVRRRKKELGIYMTLGMKKGRISHILILETTFVGLFSLVMGLIAGIFASQGLSLLTAKLFGASIKRFSFVFSSTAAGKAVIYFGVAFLVVMLFNTVNISRQKLLNLIYANRKNEAFKAPNIALSFVLFLVSVVLVGFAYHIILKDGMMNSQSFIRAIILGVIGSFLFFFSLSGFFLTVVSRMKGIYFKNLNLFVLKQINSRINTAYISMTLVCLMLFIGISSISVGSSMSAANKESLKALTPYDATLRLGGDKVTNTNFDILMAMKEKGTDISQIAKDYVSYDIYQAPSGIPLSGLGDNVKINELSPDMMRLSDYNALMKMQGEPELSLNENEFAICSNVSMKGWKENLTRFLADGNSSFTNNGMTIHPKKGLHLLTESTDTDTSLGGLSLIVPDAFVEGCEKTDLVLSMNFVNPEGEAAAGKLLDIMTIGENGKTNSSKDSIYDSLIAGEGTLDTAYATRTQVIETTNITSTAIAYLTLYVGIVFLLTCASVLAIAQLSEASDNQERYRLLSKLGASKKQIASSVFRQIFIYFAIPLVLAAAHSVIAIKSMSDIVSAMGDMDVLAMSLVTGVLMIGIYGGYFLITYFTAKRMAVTAQR